MKKITVAICLDDELGMMFNKRRQSRDRVLIHELIDSTEGPIHIHPYSSMLFGECERIRVSDDPLKSCGDGELAFIEHLPLLSHLSDIETLIVYRWNRLYPADKYLDIDISSFKLTLEYEFEGSSHEKITKGIYTK